MVNEKERGKAIAWNVGVLVLTLGVAAVVALCAWPLQMLVARGMTPDAFRDAGAYFNSLAVHGPKPWLKFLWFILVDAPTNYDGKAFVDIVGRVLGAGWRPDQIAALDGPIPESPGWGALFVGASAVILLSIGIALNPYEMRYKSQGSARWATWRDCVENRLVARVGGGEAGTTGVILGAYKYWSPLRPFSVSQIPLRNWECLSTVDLAPPGTGKSVQLTANLLADWPDTKEIPAPSIIVNDPKGELCATTGAWRSQLGPVFVLNWGEMEGDSWNPLSPASIPGGEEAARLRERLLERLTPLYGGETQAVDALNSLFRAVRDIGGQDADGNENWRQAVIKDPSFGFLIGSQPLDIADPAAASLAFAGASKGAGLLDDFSRLIWCYDQREKIVDRMVAVLIPDTVEEHWRNTGRAAGAGFILFHMARCDREGTEPSFGRMLDWLGGVSKSAPDANVEAIAAAQGKPGQGEDGKDDEIALLLQQAIAEATAYGYPPRVALELGQLKMKPDRERGSVVSTFDASIGVFKQASVRRKTMTSSFRLIDIRGQGTLNPHNGKPFAKGTMPPPVTIYVCVRLDSIAAFGKVTGLFVEAAAAFLLSQDTDEIKKSRPVYFFLDEFWTLPPLQSLLQIPAFGRGQRVGLYLLGQSWNQLGLAFKNSGPDMIRSMKAAVSTWIVKTQAALDDAKEISDLIGQATHKKWSISRQTGFRLNFSGASQGLDIGGGNRSEDLVGLPLMRPDELASMEKLDPVKKHWGRQLILLSGQRNRPIDAGPYVWFRDARMRGRAGKALPFIDRGRWFAPVEIRKPPKPANDAGGDLAEKFARRN